MTRDAAVRAYDDGLALPFADGAFDRVFASHFHGHLHEEERAAAGV